MKKTIVRKSWTAGLSAVLFFTFHSLLSTQPSHDSQAQDVNTVPPGWGAFSNGILHLVLSSHQDIAWMDSPHACEGWRDRNLITPALDLMAREPDYRFSMEDVLMLLEYLDRHPERLDDIIRFTKQGRLEWGAIYTQPYESLLSGEQLVRQTYLGRKLLKKLLPGCDTRAAFNPDVPGRAMQMPQILHKAGIEYLLMSRHAEGLFKWLSPDGTGILTFSPGHYYDHRVFMQGDVPVRMGKVRTHLDRMSGSFESRRIPNRYAILYDKDWEVPESYRDFMDRWNVLANRDSQNGIGAAPRVQYSTFEAFMDSVTQTGAEFKTLTGERPNLWLYIHGPTHHWAITAQREAAALLPAAETFAAAASLIGGNFKDYPSREFEQAWKDALYPDHGWGGYNGDITDHTFRVRYESARDAGRRILDKSLRSIAGRIRIQRSRLPIVVFNTLSWNRTDPVACTVKQGPGPFCVKDESGNPVPFQRLKDLSDEDSRTGNARILFMAEDVPSLGYKTFYAGPG
jgi:alpha-mannosidase